LKPKAKIMAKQTVAREDINISHRRSTAKLKLLTMTTDRVSFSMSFNKY